MLILYSMLTRCSIIINTTGGMRDYLVEFISSVCCSIQLIYNAKNASASLCLFPNRMMYTTTQTVKQRCCYGNQARTQKVGKGGSNSVNSRSQMWGSGGAAPSRCSLSHKRQF